MAGVRTDMRANNQRLRPNSSRITTLFYSDRAEGCAAGRKEMDRWSERTSAKCEKNVAVIKDRM